MGIDSVTLRRAQARLDRERQQREQGREDLRRTLFAKEPELAQIDHQLRGTVLEIVNSSLQKGSDPGPALRVLKSRNMDLQVRQAQLLRGLGYPADALDDQPVCALCGDTGWVGARMCQCLKRLCAQEQVALLDQRLDFEEQSFDSFSLDWYSPRPWPGEDASPRDNMDFLRDLCFNYAKKFGKFYFKNLFLTGDPGLGKTFLSACIAKTVAEQGFSVLYETANELFAAFEAKKFDRDPTGENGRQVRRYLGCDLLILDDLGSELVTPFIQSALYTLVNTRLTAGLATIISSNLSMGGVRERYSGQTASRLEGEYRTLRFYGEDIRLQKKARL